MSEIIICLIKNDNTKILINQYLTSITNPANFNDFSNYLHIKAKDGKSFEFRDNLRNEFLLDFKDIKEIYIRCLSDILLSTSEDFLLLRVKHHQFAIVGETLDLNYIFNNLPENFVKCDNIKFDINQAVKGSIKIEENGKQSSDKTSWIVYFTPKDQSMILPYDIQFTASRQEAKYILDYHHIRNRNKLLKACKD